VASSLRLNSKSLSPISTFWQPWLSQSDLLSVRLDTLRLMPSEAQTKDLRADYCPMTPMTFDDKPPSFDDALA